MKTIASVVLAIALTLQATEPAPRSPAGTTIKTAAPLTYISGVVELPGGRLLISDHQTPRLVLLTPSTGALAPVGSAGANAGQFVRPGGFYGIAGKALWMIDRGVKRAVAVSADGALGPSHSVLPRGTTGSSSADYDTEQVDQQGLVYSLHRDMRAQLQGDTAAPLIDLVRLDPATQQMTTITRLRQRITRTSPGGDGMTYSRAVHGSSADGWGVAADGRVAVVRAAPYRVDWYSAAGTETRGAEYPVDVLPMTEADKQAAAERAGTGASVGMSTARGSGAPSRPPMLFADTKAPFDPERIMVSASGRVVVPRSTPHGSAFAVFDVFDGRGRRVDRIQLPPTARVVGFGPASIYVREDAGDDVVVLKRYEVK